MTSIGRPREFDRDRALDAAMLLFWRQGYEPTSLAHLKLAMGGISSASFYGTFGSKEAVYREALAHYIATHGQVLAPMHDKTLAPRDALEQMLRASARLQTNKRLPSGCMVVLSAANASPKTKHLQAPAASERRRNRAAIKTLIQRAVNLGQLKADTNVAGLATLFDALLVGMSTQARDGVPPSAIEAAVSSLFQLWAVNEPTRADSKDGVST